MGAAWALGALSHRRGRGTGRGHPAAEAGGSTALSVGHGSRKPQRLTEQLVTAPTEPRCRELPSRERRRRSQGRSREPLRRAWSSCRRCLSCAALETPWGTEGSCRGARCSRPPDLTACPRSHTLTPDGSQAPRLLPSRPSLSSVHSFHPTASEGRPGVPAPGQREGEWVPPGLRLCPAPGSRPVLNLLPGPDTEQNSQAPLTQEKGAGAGRSDTRGRPPGRSDTRGRPSSHTHRLWPLQSAVPPPAGADPGSSWVAQSRQG